MSYGEVLVDKSAIGLILRVLDYIVAISFRYTLYCVCFHFTVVVLNCFVMCGCVYVWDCNAYVFVIRILAIFGYPD